MGRKGNSLENPLADSGVADDPLHGRAQIYDNDQGKWVLLDESEMKKRWPQYAEINAREREDLWRK